MLPTPDQGWRLSLAGFDFAVWEKSATELPSGNEPAGDSGVSSKPNP